jgi:hypothetical protein
MPRDKTWQQVKHLRGNSVNKEQILRTLNRCIWNVLLQVRTNIFSELRPQNSEVHSAVVSYDQNQLEQRNKHQVPTCYKMKTWIMLRRHNMCYQKYRSVDCTCKFSISIWLWTKARSTDNYTPNKRDSKASNKSKTEVHNETKKILERQASLTKIGLFFPTRQLNYIIVSQAWTKNSFDTTTW